jgi:outer membrane biosynthesis protein TonB
MDGGMISLPLRVGIGSARILLRTAGTAAGCAARLGGRVTVAATEAATRVSDTVAWGRPAPSFEPPAPSFEAPAPSFEPSPAPEPAAPVVADLRAVPPVPDRFPGHSVNGVVAEPAEVQPPPAPPEPEPATAPPAPAAESEPVHVSEEPELVQEVAEAGAEDGAGATVNVAEPWPGYAAMTAKQVIERLADADAAELAAVQLYESFNRNRQTVRAAAERSLKSKTGRGSPN